MLSKLKYFILLLFVPFFLFSQNIEKANVGLATSILASGSNPTFTIECSFIGLSPTTIDSIVANPNDSIGWDFFTYYNIGTPDIVRFNINALSESGGRLTLTLENKTNLNIISFPVSTAIIAKPNSDGTIPTHYNAPIDLQKYIENYNLLLKDTVSIPDNFIENKQIKDNTITGDKIANNSIPLSKIIGDISSTTVDTVYIGNSLSDTTSISGANVGDILYVDSLNIAIKGETKWNTLSINPKKMGVGSGGVIPIDMTTSLNLNGYTFNITDPSTGMQWSLNPSIGMVNVLPTDGVFRILDNDDNLILEINEETGVVKFDRYGQGNITGIPYTFATFDTSGQIVEPTNLIFTDSTLKLSIDFEINGKIILDANTNLIIAQGTGTPEGNLIAGVGSTYHRKDGSAGTTLYTKTSGTGNTGWEIIGGNNETTTGSDYVLTFDSTAQAIGIEGIYSLSSNNNLALPSGVIMSGGSTTYANDSIAAVNGVDTNQVYFLSQVNDYGLPRGLGRMLYPTKTYASDNDALLNGVDYGDLYALGAGNIYAAPITTAKELKYLRQREANNLSFELLTFDTSTTEEVNIGQMTWNSNEGTLDIGLENNSVLQTGQELMLKVKNKTGSTIVDGTPVRFVGTEGNSGRLLITPAIADGSYPVYYNLGVVTQDITNNSEGYVTVFGKVRGIELDEDNTDLNCNSEVWGDSTVLYLDPLTEGCYTKTKPTGENQRVPFAVIVNSGDNGTLMVNLRFMPNITDIEGVNITNPTNGEALVYSNGVWSNSNVAVDSSLYVTITRLNDSLAILTTTIDSLSSLFYTESIYPVQYNAIDTIAVDTLLNDIFIASTDFNKTLVEVDYNFIQDVTSDADVRLLFYDKSADSFTGVFSGTITTGNSQITVTSSQAIEPEDIIFVELQSTAGNIPNGLKVKLKFR